MSGPVVTVVVTCFNQETSIRAAVESVLVQTRSGDITRVVVVDDGSTDNSAEIIRSLATQHPIVMPIFRDNGGAAAARNTGISAAVGTHIAFLDGDDRWLPNKLEVQLPIVASLPLVGLFYSDFVVVDELTEPPRRMVHHARALRHDDDHTLRTLFLQGGSILPSTAVVRRDAFDRCGLFDTELRHNEDPDMWLRIAADFPLQRIAGILVVKCDVADSLGADIDANAAGQRYITEKMVQMRPDLRRYARRRDAAIEMRSGHEHLIRGERRLARSRFLRSIAKHPLNRRTAQAALYLCVSILPCEPRRALTMVKRLLPSRIRV